MIPIKTIIAIGFIVSPCFAEIKITKADCDALIINADPMDNVAYQPDSSVNVSNSINLKLPSDQTMTIPLSLNLNRYVNQGQRHELNARAFIGGIVRKPDGRLYFNGQPLFDNDEAIIKEACKNLK